MLQKPEVFIMRPTEFELSYTFYLEYHFIHHVILHANESCSIQIHNITNRSMHAITSHPRKKNKAPLKYQKTCY